MNTGSFPRKRWATEQAWVVLKRLSNQMTDKLKRRPTADEFYPVDLRDVIGSVLRWKLEEITSLASLTGGQAVVGQCDFQSKTIRLDTFQAHDKAEENFTLAHEIGHAILHAPPPSGEEREGYCFRPTSERRSLLFRGQLSLEERAKEMEANEFAAVLLMPEKAVRAKFERVFAHSNLWSGSSRVDHILGATWRHKSFPGHVRTELEQVAWAVSTYQPSGNASSLKKFFEVSPTAMTRRLIELRLVY